MKEDRFNITEEQIKKHLLEARVLRSQEVSRLSGLFCRAPIRLLNRFTAFKIESAKAAVESR
jgi:hypothetical protein